MSCHILVIPEDPTYNGYILKPLVGRMMSELGKPHAHVHVLTNPRLNGYSTAVRAIKEELVERYKHFNLWLFFPDADVAGDLLSLENELLEKGITLFCCAAKPEVEIWLLAGFRSQLDTPWSRMRTHTTLKETVFEPVLLRHGRSQSPGAGRSEMMRETLRNYDGLLQMCPELADLQKRLNNHRVCED